ncbi:MAG: peptidase MA domain-containing protein [Dehalococcoidales bacterium]|nr:peptidase MA domain-containing protein [Dehalococcoidales bacterium]
MIKKVSALVLTVFLLLTVLAPGLVSAQPELTIVSSSAEADFPTSLNFSVSAESNVDITDIRLHYRVDRISLAQVTSEVYIEFTPAKAVSINWPLQMVKIGGLPPGSGVDYWWTVEDAASNKRETAPARVQFDDERYSWSSLTEGEVTLYWYEGDLAIARRLMTVAQQTLVWLKEDTGAELERPVRIYIYADSRDLQGAMIYPQEWTGGVAFTRFGTVAIGISSTDLDWGSRAIAHELTHLVIHQVTLNPYSDLPTWLDEGLAMHTEGPLEPVFVASLNRAIEENSLISVRSLLSPFSAYPDKATLSYAQSYSLVEFLLSNYGHHKMLELLEAIKQDDTCDGILEKVYGVNVDGLDSLWQQWVPGWVKSQLPSSKNKEPVPTY